MQEPELWGDELPEEVVSTGYPVPSYRAHIPLWGGTFTNRAHELPGETDHLPRAKPVLQIP